MTALIQKTIKLLLANERTTYLESMAVVKEQLSANEWSELQSISLFEILQNVTVQDTIVLASNE